jgi:hypothetical protein
MNIKTIIVGSVAIALAIGGTLINTTSEENQALYTPRNINNGGVTGQAGYAEYLNMLKADPVTGKVDYQLVNQARNEVIARRKQNNKAALGLNWTQMGPDNVGGRTRAVMVDRFNSNVVYAGGISGGLFVSTDGSQSWNPAIGQEGILGENLAVSCITQTDNGRVFFGTGSDFESATGNQYNGEDSPPGFLGNGVYEYVPASGNILPVLTNTTAPNNDTSSLFSAVNAIASSGNRLYLGTRDGMVWADDGGSGYPTTFAGWINPIDSSGIPEQRTCQDIDIASDGSMLVCFKDKVYNSNSDAVGSFSGTNILGDRISGASAPNNSNVFYLLRAKKDSILLTGPADTIIHYNLAGISITQNKGGLWETIVPPGSSSIDPFLETPSSAGQGFYDQAIAVDPSDWGHILVGGVHLYEWRYATGSNPIGGSWLLAATLSNGFGPFGVHADKHSISWPSSNEIYLGTDGGVYRSVDGGTSWQDRNLGFNVTQFVDIAISANGWMVGGSQDNGTQFFSFGLFGEPTPLGTTQISGGDGMDCAFSNFGPGIVYTTSQNGALTRSSGGFGTTFYDGEISDLGPGIGGSEPFHTVIKNWEKSYDPNSIDSVLIIFDTVTSVLLSPGNAVFAGGTINAGDTIWYTSASGSSLMYINPTIIILNTPLDTLKLIDPIQNRFAFRTSGGIFFTREAGSLSTIDVEWHKISPVSNVESMEFSPDGSSLFLGTTNGDVWRVSGFSSSTDSLLVDIRNTYTGLDPDSILLTTSTLIGTGLGGVVTGLATDPNDGENMIATVGGYTIGDHVYRCINALTAVSAPGTFVAIPGTGGTSLPKMPVYDAAIEYNDNDKVIIGTEWGVWTSDNAFSAAPTAVQWTDESGNGMTHVPVFTVEQQTLRSNQSANSGFVYLGTHGRGFYSSADLFTAVNEYDDIASNDNSFVSNLNVYPNPLNNIGMLSFNLKVNADATVNIYNLTGSIVKTIKLGMLTEGQHKEQFDASSLSVGSYIISLESGSERSVAKFIVTR